MAFDELVSIVLPTYNGARYLAGSIASCLRQTHGAIELIVVVDGSTDGTDGVLRDVHDPRVRVIRHDANRGLPASLNAGLRAATGRFLAWTSDDNRYLPRAVETLLAALLRPGNERTDLAYADYFVVDERDRAIDRVRLPPPDLCLSRGNGVGACFLARRAFFERTGDYAEDLQGVEDYEYWLRAREGSTFVHVDRPFYAYRTHPASLTSRFREAIDRETDRVKRRYLPLYRFEREAGPAPLPNERGARGFSAMIAAPPLPPLDPEDARPAATDFAPPGAVVATPEAVREIAGLSGGESAQETVRAVLRLGGSVGWRVGTDPGRSRPVSRISWTRVGVRMNELDNRPARAVLRRALWAAVHPRAVPGLLPYALGVLLGKARTVVRLISAPFIRRLWSRRARS